MTVVLAAQMSGTTPPGAPDAPDLQFTTRTSIDHPQATVSTTSRWYSGVRRRSELRLTEGPTGRQLHASVEIVHCDHGRAISLNPDGRLYAVLALRQLPRETTRDRPAQSGETVRPPAGMARMIIEFTDTGEVRQLGRYEARRFLTTRTEVPVAGTSSVVKVQHEDGWYLDVPAMDCEEHNGLAYLVATRAGESSPQVELRGTPPRGIPIELTRRSEVGGRELITRTELIEISEAPIDPAVFEIPTGYRPALPLPGGGHDLTRPDTWANRARVYVDRVAGWWRRLWS